MSQENELFRREAIDALSDRHGDTFQQSGLTTWALTAFFFALFLSLILFLVTARHTRKETVSGLLEPAAGALRVVSARPGIITAVNVREGDIVTAGAPLITIGSNSIIEGGQQLGAVLSSTSNMQKAALGDQAQAQRTSAERQRDELVARRNGLLAKQARFRADLELQTERVALSIASREAVRPLMEKGYFSELQFRQREEIVIQARQSLSGIERQIEETSSALVENAIQIERSVADAEEAAAKITSQEAEIQGMQASYSAEREITLTAPRAGRVVALQAKPGGAVTAAAALAIILPQGTSLEAQLWAPSRAVGFLQPGDRVRLMYDAFPYQRFGVGHGHVIRIADAPTNPNELAVPIETREALYKITVALDAQTVEAHGATWKLFPGARLSADLVLESRPLLAWLFDPVLAVKRRSQ